jgi:hypothetical protein
MDMNSIIKKLAIRKADITHQLNQNNIGGTFDHQHYNSEQAQSKNNTRYSSGTTH